MGSFPWWLPLEDVGLYKTGQGELVEPGIVLGDADARLVEVTAEDFPRAECFRGEREDSRAAPEVEERPRFLRGTQRSSGLDEKLEAACRGGMISRAEGHAARDQKGSPLARGAFLLEEILIPVDPEFSRDPEWVGDLGGGGLPPCGIEWTDGSAERLLQFLSGGGIGVEIESD